MRDSDYQSINGVALTIVDELDEIVLRSMDIKNQFSEIYTGVSGHMRGSINRKKSLRKYDDNIILGNEKSIKATIFSDKHGYITNKKGERKKVAFKDIKFVPDLTPYNLCFIS